MDTNYQQNPITKQPIDSRFTWNYLMSAILVLVSSIVLIAYTSTQLLAQDEAGDGGDNSGASLQVFLPLVNGGSGSGNSVTPTPTVTPTPSPTINVTPGPVSEPRSDPDPAEIVYPQNGICAPGTHLVHLGRGWANYVVGDDEGQALVDSDYRCAPDQTLADAQCSARGTPVLLGGQAACQCEAGYAGATCNICAPGFAMNPGTQQCEAVAPQPTVAVSGIEQSLEPGASTVFIAKDEAGNPVDALWTLGLADDTSQVIAATAANFAVTGCLFPLSGGGTCQESVQGSRVGYRAPESLPSGQEVQMVQVNIDPLANGNLGLTTESVVIVGQGGVPITGHGDPRMQPVLDIVSRYMRQRCIGAASLGISRYGHPLAVYGFGREDGRAAADWHDYCGDDEGQPLADPIDHQTAFRYGSANKPITFATLRYVLKERLADHDTDLDIAAVGDARYVTAQRRHPGQIRLALWDVNSRGELTAGDTADFDPSTVGGSSTHSHDFAVAVLPNQHVLLAVRDDENRVRFGIWSVDNQVKVPQLVQRTTGTLGALGFIQENVVDVEVLSLRDNLIGANRFVIGVRTVNGSINLFVFQETNPNNVQLISYLTDGNARARMLSLADVSGTTGSRITVGYANGEGKLVLRTYNVPENGEMTQLDSAGAGTTLALDMVNFGTNRLITGVRTKEEELKLISWQIGADGALSRLNDITADPVLDFDLTMINTEQVMAVSRLTSNGSLKLATWNMSNDGSFTLIDEDAAGGVSALGVQSLFSGHAAVVVRTQENFLKTIIWELASGSLTRRGDATGLKNPDSVWDDSAIERMRLTGFDLPELLLPTKLHRVYNGDATPPVLLPEVKDDDDNVLCSALTQSADPIWQQTTVGDILKHRTGLPHSAPGLTTQVTNLHLLRNLHDQSAFQQQEAPLRAEYGDATVNNGKALLGYGGSTVYVVPPPTIDEIFMLVAGRCIPYPLGNYRYSNTNAAMAGYLVNHLADRFAAKQGYPATHEGSGLDRFFANTLGVETTGNSGAFEPQRIPNLPGYVQRTPRLRAWNSDAGTYSLLWYDQKRPHCVWSGNSCDFSDWLDAAGRKTTTTTHGALQWFLNSTARLGFQFASAGPGSGSAGNLAMEPGVFLRFLNNHWVSSTLGGQARNDVWNVFRSHNGAAGGTKGRIVQYGPLAEDKIHWDLPRTSQTDYLPITAADTFTETEPAYFAAHVLTGRIITYNPDGVPAGALDVNYSAGDRFAVGQNGFFQSPDSFYIARAATGMVDIYQQWSGEQRSYPIDFAAEDSFIVDDLRQFDIYDEVVIGDVSNGEVRIYPAWPIAINGVVNPTAVLNLNFAVGDKLAVGDYNGDGRNELYIARAATGQVQIYAAEDIFAGSNPTPVKSKDVGYSADDGFAVSNVLGTLDKDEVIVARVSNQMIDVYNYAGNNYDLYTSFHGAYQVGHRLAVNDLGYGTILNEILVSLPGSGVAVFTSVKNDAGDYVFYLRQFFPGGESPLTVADDLAAGYWRGVHRATCAYGQTGVRQNLPDGVDLVFSINTSADKQCVDGGNCDSYAGTIRGNMLNHAICQVNWANVISMEP